MTAGFDWRGALPTLPASRIELRPLVAEDADAIFAIFGDPEVVRYWSAPPLTDLSAARGLLEEIRIAFETRRLFQWGIEESAAARLVGTCTLFHLDPRHARAEIGFALRRDAWGRGLAREAVARLARFAFDVLELHRLEADVDPDNARSLRLLEGLGFRREGRLRERWKHLGEARDGVFLGLLRREWTGGDAPHE